LGLIIGFSYWDLVMGVEVMVDDIFVVGGLFRVVVLFYGDYC
jgi:hypothetical protein